MDSSAFSKFILSLVSELMSGITAAYIEQEERLIELLSEFNPNIDGAELEEKFRAILEESIRPEDADLTAEEIDSKVHAMIESHRVFGRRLLEQNFPKLIIDNGELSAKFVFGSDTTETDVEESPADAEVSQSSSTGPLADDVGESAEATQVQPLVKLSHYTAVLNVPAYAKVAGTGARPTAVVTPISTMQGGSESSSSDLVSEVRLKFRTVYDS